MVNSRVELARLVKNFVRDILSDDPHKSSLASDACADLARDYTNLEAQVLTSVLALSLELESDPVALESKLNALSEFASDDRLDRALAEQIANTKMRVASVSASEHLEAITRFARSNL